MKRLLIKEQLLTIPNILSIFRIILLVPIVILYAKEKYVMAILLLFVSGLSDIADGFIARKFNMISAFGKIIDPVADKLTQFSLLLCLSLKHKFILVVVSLFFLKEVLLMTISYNLMKKNNSVNSAKWHGKLNTVIIYSVIVLLIMFPQIPENIVNTMCMGVMVTMFISFALYAKMFLENLKK